MLLMLMNCTVSKGLNLGLLVRSNMIINCLEKIQLEFVIASSQIEPLWNIYVELSN